MDITATLTEVRSMSVDDRIRLVQALLDTIAEDQDPPDLTEAQRQELDRRIADLDASPNNILTWEQIKAHVLRDKR